MSTELGDGAPDRNPSFAIYWQNDPRHATNISCLLLHLQHEFISCSGIAVMLRFSNYALAQPLSIYKNTFCLRNAEHRASQPPHTWVTHILSGIIPCCGGPVYYRMFSSILGLYSLGAGIISLSLETIKNISREEVKMSFIRWVEKQCRQWSITQWWKKWTTESEKDMENLKCSLLSVRSQPDTATYGMTPTTWHSKMVKPRRQ